MLGLKIMPGVFIYQICDYIYSVVIKIKQSHVLLLMNQEKQKTIGFYCRHT